MRILKTSTVAALLALSAACASQQEPAEAATRALESAATAARPEIERFAADRWPAVNDAVTSVQGKLAAGDYAGVLADAPAASQTVAEATTAAAAQRAALTAEWASFADIPVKVQQVTQKVAEITRSRRLPPGLDPAALDGVRATISGVTALMGEASQAFESGDLAGAVARARNIRPRVEQVLATLGMTAAGR
jgi:hypothetical protein